MTDSSAEQAGELPLPREGEVRYYTGTVDRGDGRDLEMYVWGESNGYDIAVKNGDGEWEFEQVTKRWSVPNMYTDWRRSTREEFPER
jgi:hypothetical protein